MRTYQLSATSRGISWNKIVSYQSKQDPLQHNPPSISEVGKFVRLHPASFDCALAKCFEQGNHKCHKEAEDDEKDQSSQENVGLFDSCPEAYSVDSTDDKDFASCSGRSSRSFEDGIDPLPNQAANNFDAPLLDLN